MFSNIILKLADLCRYTRRPRMCMVFEVVASCILMMFYDFLVTFHVSFRFVLGLISEAIWVRFGIYFWSFCGSKGDQHVIKNRCGNWHRKKSIPRTSEYEITSRAGGQEGVPPLRRGAPPGSPQGHFCLPFLFLSLAFPSSSSPSLSFAIFAPKKA